MPPFSHRPSPDLVIVGTFIDAPSPRTLRVRRNHYAIISGKTGKITHLAQLSEAGDEPVQILGEEGYRQAVVVWLLSSQFVCPGMVDTHCHAPQYRQLGSANNLPLLDWLNKVTFPNEAKCRDPEYATMLYTRLIKRLLRNGTTTALYFATIHLEASKILANLCSSLGQRGYVGKLNADQLSPDYYTETTASSLRDTESFIQYCHAEFLSTKSRSSTVLPVITPRFIPTCSYPLLQGLGALAAKYDCHVQSHAAETVDQLTLVRQQYPEKQRDAEIFSSVGLLRPGKTVLAHCVHLHDAEVDLFAREKIGIAACPLSNILYSRGVVPVQRYLAKGARVGLGTDFGGGPTAGMLSAVRGAILADRTVEFADIERGNGVRHWPENKECNWDVDFLYAYHLATVGSATALGLGEVIGKFELGFEFDALQIECNLAQALSPWDFFPDDDSETLFEKWINLGDERNIIRVWMQGKDVTVKD